MIRPDDLLRREPPHFPMLGMAGPCIECVLRGWAQRALEATGREQQLRAAGQLAWVASYPAGSRNWHQRVLVDRKR